jgi:rSAM/selenodomain-associated transferase 2
VIIPTLNERDSLPAVLACTAGPGVERLVVDAGSGDGTADAARALGAERVIVGPRGRAAQLEAGRRAAGGDVLLFLHADTSLPPGWPDAVRAALAEPRVAGGAFRLRFASEGAVYRWLERGVRLRCRLLRLPYGDQALFVRRTVLERAGGVPPVPLFEDLDIARIITRAGRLALLDLPALTSSRRYRTHGVLRTIIRNNLALGAFLLGLDRARVAAWYARRPRT